MLTHCDVSRRSPSLPDRVEYMSSNIRVNRICQHCGNDFIAKTTVTMYCSDRCSRAAYKKRIADKNIQKSNREMLSLVTGPWDALKAKEFLSIPETATLTGISVRTVQVKSSPATRHFFISKLYFH